MMGDKSWNIWYAMLTTISTYRGGQNLRHKRNSVRCRSGGQRDLLMFLLPGLSGGDVWHSRMRLRKSWHVRYRYWRCSRWGIRSIRFSYRVIPVLRQFDLIDPEELRHPDGDAKEAAAHGGSTPIRARPRTVKQPTAGVPSARGLWPPGQGDTCESRRVYRRTIRVAAGVCPVYGDSGKVWRITVVEVAGRRTPPA